MPHFSLFTVRIISSRSFVNCWPFTAWFISLLPIDTSIRPISPNLHVHCKNITLLHGSINAQTATELIPRAEMPFNYQVSIKMHSARGGTIWRQYCLPVYFPTRDVWDIIYLISALFVNNILLSLKFKIKNLLSNFHQLDYVACRRN